MKNFCGSQFWNENITWNSDHPDFTECFQETTLVWVPCAFLWLFAPLELYMKFKKKTKQIPWSILLIAKLVLVFILGILSVAEVVHAATLYSNEEDVSPSYYSASFIKALSFLLVIVLINLSKRRGIHTSGTLFFFWLLFLCKEIVTYNSVLRKLFDEDLPYSSSGDVVNIILLSLSFPLVLVAFILSCFADSRSPFSLPGEDPLKESPEESASFLSQVTFSWFDGMAFEGYRKPLVMKDMWTLNSENATKSIMERFDKFWTPLASQVQRRSPSTVNADGFHSKVSACSKTEEEPRISVLFSVMKTFWWPLSLSGLLKLITSLLAFVGPIILNLLITFVSSDEPYWRGFFYAGILLLASMLESLFANQYEYYVNLSGMRIRSALSTAIFRKSLVLSSSARRNYTVGEIVNLMAVDIQRIVDYVLMVHLLWAAPLQIIIALYMLWQQIGVSTLGGLGVLLLLTPFSSVITMTVRKLQILVMKIKDKRTKLMNEVLNGIKVLKLYAWEESFEEKVKDFRGSEVRVMEKQAYLMAFITFLFTAAPFLVSLASFAMYVLVDSSNVLDANKAFVSLSLFNLLRTPFALLPIVVVNASVFLVSMKRLNIYLSSMEIDPNAVKHDENSTYTVQVEHGSFSWGTNEAPLLENINFSTRPGSLLAVIGTVGSGKSSLLSSLLGDMERISGIVNIQGKIAYVPQEAWIQNCTLQENILFNKPIREAFYKQVLESCCLNPDLEILPGGDQTEIGEKGINLSGGQKQRVSLARAVYSDADIFLLDDPLSAVDAHVSKDLFDKVIGPKGMLSKKTRILVTHRITVLPECDTVMVLKDGMISEMGSYQELLKQHGAFADFILQHLSQGISEDSIAFAEDLKLIDEIVKTVGSPELKRQLSRLSGCDDESLHSESDQERSAMKRLSSQISETFSTKSVDIIRHRSSTSALKNKAPEVGKVSTSATVGTAKLTEEEQAEVGSVKWSVYLSYMKACGLWSSFWVMFSFFSAYAFNVGSSVWLSVWSNDALIPGTANDTALRDLRLGVYGALGTAESFLILVAAIVLSLCTVKGSHLIHNQSLEHILQAPMSFFDTTPMGRILNRFSKDIDSMDNVIRFNLRIFIISIARTCATVIVISLQTAYILLAVIPIGFIYYLVQKYFIFTSRQLKRLESVSRSPIYTHFSETVAGSSSIRAYGADKQFIQMACDRMDTNNTTYYPTIAANRWLAVRLEFLGYSFSFIAALFAILGKDTLSAGIVGLSLSYAMTITMTLNSLVRASTDVETNIVSVERCLEYTVTPTEAPRRIASYKPPPTWPEEGRIQFNGYSTRYREGLDLVLRQINCDIKSSERVGIVGRTGAGKSSLTLCLFRLIEAAEGNILIDGVDLSKLGLYDLRSKLTIIPQEPVLFAGSLRMNLDPFSAHTDDEIWTALEQCHLKDYISTLEQGFDYYITEGGENFSVGQRQLLCLGRALLRKTKVLIMDEATAAVDMETDELIQSTIRSEFKDCTVLTIAHRLNTIMDYDRVIVLDMGKIAEFESPSGLLQNQSSIFHSMAKDAGLV